jgi:hypothetical protein
LGGSKSLESQESQQPRSTVKPAAVILSDDDQIKHRARQGEVVGLPHQRKGRNKMEDDILNAGRQGTCEFERDPHPYTKYCTAWEPIDDQRFEQPTNTFPGQLVTVKHTVVDSFEREALRLLEERGYVVYKINGGKASLD